MDKQDRTELFFHTIERRGWNYNKSKNTKHDAILTYFKYILYTLFYKKFDVRVFSTKVKLHTHTCLYTQEHSNSKWCAVLFCVECKLNKAARAQIVYDDVFHSLVF